MTGRPPFLTGPSQPRTSVLVGGGSAPAPRVTFVRTKVNRKSAKTKVLDSFIQSVFIRFAAAQSLNQIFWHLICGGFLIQLRLTPC